MIEFCRLHFQRERARFDLVQEGDVGMDVSLERPRINDTNKNLEKQQ